MRHLCLYKDVKNNAQKPRIYCGWFQLVKHNGTLFAYIPGRSWSYWGCLVKVFLLLLVCILPSLPSLGKTYRVMTTPISINQYSQFGNRQTRHAFMFGYNTQIMYPNTAPLPIKYNTNSHMLLDANKNVLTPRKH